MICVSPTFYTEFASPVGPLLLAATGKGLCGLWFKDARHAVGPTTGWLRSEEPFAAVRQALTQYFEGVPVAFDVPLDLKGSDFQRSVWQALQTIPYGKTASYGELAAAIGRPRAVRALGAANGRNPVSIIVPCHMVIGANGALTGYAGGLFAKRFLLELEGRSSRLL